MSLPAWSHLTPRLLAAALLLAGCGRGEPVEGAPPEAAAGTAQAQGGGAPLAPSSKARTSGPGVAASAPAQPAQPACPDAGAGPEPDAGRLHAFVRAKSRAAQLRDCFRRSLLRDASAGGRATFQFTIGSCGELSGVRVAERRGRVDDPAACVASAMRGWRTSFRPAEPVTVEYPVAFSASM